MLSALSQAELEKEAHNHAGRCQCHLHLDWAFRTAVGTCSVVSWVRSEQNKDIVGKTG